MWNSSRKNEILISRNCISMFSHTIPTITIYTIYKYKLINWSLSLPTMMQSLRKITDIVICNLDNKGSASIASTINLGSTNICSP